MLEFNELLLSNVITRTTAAQRKSEAIMKRHTRSRLYN